MVAGVSTPRGPELDRLERGRPLEHSAAVAIKRLLGREVGLEGLSSLFQPSFPGVRTFAIEERAAPDQAVELTLIGVSRDGVPVWTGTRALVSGRDGSLEIHRGFDEVEPEFQSRNFTTDLIHRELELLAHFGAGRAARLTIDADGIGRYVCALHGFIFADETEEGPPLRSVRAFEPDGDRERLIEAALAFLNRMASKVSLGKIATEATAEAIRACRSPWDFARLSISDSPRPWADGPDGAMGVGAFGRAFLLSPKTPSWRGALPLHREHLAESSLAARYRVQKTRSSEDRLRREVDQALGLVRTGQRNQRVQALKRLAQIAPASALESVKAVTQDADRRVATVARQCVRRISGADLPDLLLRTGLDERREGRTRGLALRVLAEHYPARVEGSVSMLRIHPDARLQRAVLPLIDDGPALASMLAANPRQEERPGVEGLRIELIERLTQLRDPSTLPVLIAAYRKQPPPEPKEQLALSRALVTFPDPRAQVVLAEPRAGGTQVPIP